MIPTKKYVTALTIAGSDCSGGAGIQADIKTLSALGVYAASAVTAITVQNTLGVRAVEPVSPQTVADQIRAVLSDIAPAAVKTGMVTDGDTIHAIASALTEFPPVRLVVDPVMVSSSGMRLMCEDALDVFMRKLLPLTTVLTPNLPEAGILAGNELHSVADIDEAGCRLSDRTGAYVLVKGGHAEENGHKCDRLYNKGVRIAVYESDTVPTPNTHGTGCTLSAAITAHLACGHEVPEAVALAKQYMTEALRQGSDVRIGRGCGPVNHFFCPRPLVKKGG